MKRRTLVIILIACLAIELTFIVWRPFRKADNSDRIVAAVERGELEARAVSLGIAKPVLERTLTGPAGATVVALQGQLGQQVEAGQVLAELGSPETESAFRLAEANLAVAEADLAKLQGPRADTTDQVVAAARQRVAKAEDSLKRCQDNLASLSGVAPAGGVVSAIAAAIGDTIQAGQAIVTLVDLQALQFTALVNPSQLADYSVGQVVAMHWGGPGRSGTVTSISPVATGTLRQIAVVIDLKPADDGLRPGMTGILANPLNAGGTVSARTYTVAARTTATVTSIPVTVGDTVAPGDVLFTEASRSAELALTDAEIELANANAALADLLVPRAGVDEPAIMLQEARVQQARVQYQNALAAAEALTVRSPIAGTVTACNAQEGDRLSGQALFIVSDLSTAQVTVNVGERDLVRLAKDTQARVLIGALGDREYTATVDLIGMQPVQAGGAPLYPVRVLVGDAAGILPGMTASVTITLDRRESATYVPNEAVRRLRDKLYVDVVQYDGALKPTEVTVGLSNEIYTEILTGVFEGQEVVLGSADAAAGISIPSLWAPTGGK